MGISEEQTWLPASITGDSLLVTHAKHKAILNHGAHLTAAMKVHEASIHQHNKTCMRNDNRKSRMRANDQGSCHSTRNTYSFLPSNASHFCGRMHTQAARGNWLAAHPLLLECVFFALSNLSMPLHLCLIHQSHLAFSASHLTASSSSRKRTGQILPPLITHCTFRVPT